MINANKCKRVHVQKKGLESYAELRILIRLKNSLWHGTDVVKILFEKIALC